MEASPHILVVDNSADIREPLAKYLVKKGIRVSTANGGAEMRRLLKTSAVDLVVLDIMMPGEDGLSLCRMLRETTDMPVILLTAMVGGDRPRRRARDRRRRLRDQAVQPARAARPHPRRASPLARRCPSAAAPEAAAGSASIAGSSTPPPRADRSRRRRRAAEHGRVPPAHRVPASGRTWCCRATSCST